MTTRLRAGALLTVLAPMSVLAAACGEPLGPSRAAASPTTAQASTPTAPSPSERVAPLPCDPSLGFPEPRTGCPDPHPETGWLTALADRVTLTPFRALTNDAEGRTYARAHGLEFPFSDDTFDAPAGPGRLVELGPQTVCSGAIMVDFGGGPPDHAVGCDVLVGVAARRRVPVAIWVADGGVVQVSELYRP